MSLNLSIVDRFVVEYREALHDKTLLRRDRYAILSTLSERLRQALQDSERFDAQMRAVLEAIEVAGDAGDLAKYHEIAVAGIRNYFEEEQSVVDVYDFLRVARDRVTVRALRLVELEMERDGFGPVPSAYCWIGLGSEGRNEPTFVTDQDNMLVYLEDAGGIGHYFHEFADRAVEKLSEAGFRKCVGGIMPSNEKWRGSVAEWKRRIDGTFGQKKGSLELIDVVIMTDARVIVGDSALFAAVLDHFFSLLNKYRGKLKEIAESAVHMPTALGFFGRFRVETEGAHKGRFNVKLLGWTPLVMCIRILALYHKLYETNTLERMKRLYAAKVIRKEVLDELIESYLLFAWFRLTRQIASAPDYDALNHIDPASLSEEEAGTLRHAMSAVESLQKYIHEVLFLSPI